MQHALVHGIHELVVRVLVALLGLLKLVELGALHTVLQRLRSGGVDLVLQVLELRGREKPLAVDALAGELQQFVDAALLDVDVGLQAQQLRVPVAHVLGELVVLCA